LTIDRRRFLTSTGIALVAGAMTGQHAWSQQSAPAIGDDFVIETVTGPLDPAEVDWALAHEHLHGDFSGSNPRMWRSLPEGEEEPVYGDLDWTVVTGAAINAVNEIKAYGVNLIVDYSPSGVGRNSRMLREVSRRTGVAIVAASGLYRTAWGMPAELADYDSDQLAAHFVRELTQGTEGTSIRAGFIKLSVGNDGPLPHDGVVYRGAARASNETGSTIGIHAIMPDAFRAAARILEDEQLDLSRFIWAHAGRDGTVDFEVFREFADRGVYISFDGVTHRGTPTDEQLLDLIGQFLEADLGHKILISADATIAAHPPAAQYASDIRYPYRFFKPQLEARHGADVARMILRDNVVQAYRRGDSIG